MKLSSYHVSDILPERRWLPSELQVRQYAEVSGDFNPIHLDASYAREMGMKGVIVHGMLSMAQLGAMLADWIGDSGRLSCFEVRFLHMIYPGEEIIFTGRVSGKTDNSLLCDLSGYRGREELVLSGQAQIFFTG